MRDLDRGQTVVFQDSKFTRFGEVWEMSYKTLLHSIE